jgi:hypothetical protein
VLAPSREVATINQTAPRGYGEKSEKRKMKNEE